MLFGGGRPNKLAHAARRADISSPAISARRLSSVRIVASALCAFAVDAVALRGGLARDGKAGPRTASGEDLLEVREGPSRGSALIRRPAARRASRALSRDTRPTHPASLAERRHRA